MTKVRFCSCYHSRHSYCKTHARLRLFSRTVSVYWESSVFWRCIVLSGAHWCFPCLFGRGWPCVVLSTCQPLPLSKKSRPAPFVLVVTLLPPVCWSPQHCCTGDTKCCRGGVSSAVRLPSLCLLARHSCIGMDTSVPFLRAVFWNYKTKQNKTGCVVGEKQDEIWYCPFNML